MSAFLGLVSVAATVAVAFFTWKLTAATEKMAELQRDMIKLQKTLGEKQEQLAELQRALAEAEIRPLLSLKASVGSPAYTKNGVTVPEVYLTFENLGKFGVCVLKLSKHRRSPGVPGIQGEWVADADPFPLPVPAGSGKTATVVMPQPSRGEFLEVVYQHGTSGELLSDLWEIKRSKPSLKRIWHAQKVSTSGD